MRLNSMDSGPDVSRRSRRLGVHLGVFVQYLFQMIYLSYTYKPILILQQRRIAKSLDIFLKFAYTGHGSLRYLYVRSAYNVGPPRRAFIIVGQGFGGKCHG